MLTWDKTGLSRWDGTAWHYFKGSEHANGGFVLDGEQVWVPTVQGILRWDGQRWLRYPEATSSWGAAIVAEGGQAWVIDGNGKCSHFDGSKWRSQKLALPGVKWDEGPDTESPRLARTSDGALWLDWDGVWRFDGANWTQEKTNAWLIGATQDRVWLSEERGLLAGSIDGKQWTLYPLAETGLAKPFLVYGVSSAGRRTWFATTTGLVEFDGSQWRHAPSPGGIESIQTVAAGQDGSLWVIGTPSMGSFKRSIGLLFVIPLATLGVGFWIFQRFRRRQFEQHQRVTQAVEHATGDVPEELHSGARMLNSSWGEGILTTMVWIGAMIAYVVIRTVRPQTPFWVFPLIAVAMHVAITFRQSLVKRKPKASDPIGPGAPSRYD